MILQNIRNQSSDDTVSYHLRLVYRQGLFYIMVISLKNVTQIKHKVPI
jgi:hypothetical protein